LNLKATDTANSVLANPKSVAGGQWLVLIAAFLGWMFDGLEMGIFPLVARPALQDMMKSDGGVGGDQFVGHWMGRITALFPVGAGNLQWPAGEKHPSVQRASLNSSHRHMGFCAMAAAVG